MIAIQLHALSRVPAKSVSSAVTRTKTADEHSFFSIQLVESMGYCGHCVVSVRLQSESIFVQ